jgi:hypothetical protein
MSGEARNCEQLLKTRDGLWSWRLKCVRTFCGVKAGLEMCHMLHPTAAGAAFLGSGFVVGFTRTAKKCARFPRDLTEVGGTGKIL